MKTSEYCTLTDIELIEEAEKWIKRLINSGGRDWSLPVPANPNKDVDLILSEVVHRFKSKDSSPIEQTPSDLVNKGKDWTGVGEQVLKAMEGVTVEAAAKEHYPNNPEWQLIFELGANWQSNRLSQKEGELTERIKELETSLAFMLMLSDTWGREWFKPEIWQGVQEAKEVLKEKK